MFLERNPVYIGALWHNNYSETLGMKGVTCGNGGLSLRNTKKISQLLKTSIYRNNRFRTVEDQFITYILYKENILTKVEDAFGFSVDNYPEYWLHKLGNDMPFGVHMSRNEWKELWKPYIENDMNLSGITETYTDDILNDNINEWTNRPTIVVSLTSFGERLRNDAEIVV